MYRAMTRSFFRDAAAGIIVYDVTSVTSFKSVTSWLREFRVSRAVVWRGLVLRCLVLCGAAPCMGLGAAVATELPIAPDATRAPPQP